MNNRQAFRYCLFNNCPNPGIIIDKIGAILLTFSISTGVFLTISDISCWSILYFESTSTDVIYFATLILLFKSSLGICNFNTSILSFAACFNWLTSSS